MNRMISALALIPILNACATTLVLVSGCDLDGDGDCAPPSPEALNTAVVVDRKIFRALEGMPGANAYAPLEAVTAEGVVRSDGVPLHQATVELFMGDELWGTVRTDESGRYQIRDMLEAWNCGRLRLVFRRPNEGPTHRASIGCGESRLDHDFAEGSRLETRIQ